MRREREGRTGGADRRGGKAVEQEGGGADGEWEKCGPDCTNLADPVARATEPTPKERGHREHRE